MEVDDLVSRDVNVEGNEGNRVRPWTHGEALPWPVNEALNPPKQR